jgi:FAD dependent oxidoreductase
MLKSEPTNQRNLKNASLSADLVVVGGGLSGTCCAITAARAGIKVILVNDRPVLGGNASSEVRLWVLGATSHMGNNNRWAREGGVIDELLVENMYRNAEGNPLIFDTILLEKAVSEPNLTLLLNTAIYEVEKADDDIDKIQKIRGFCSQNATQYTLTAPLFCDASGDGTVGFLAGAAFRMGAESREEFGEKFAPSQEYGELLGHSMYFYSKDVGKPVKYVAPSFAHDVSQKVPKFRSFNAQDFGCRLWWIEYGGRLDTVHDTEAIKWELWRVVYGVWDYIKNSGKFPEAENLTLEWVGTIPGKRESRRFEGNYMLTQQDIVEQRVHPDEVAFGGWSIDLHPADGVFSEIGQSSCNQWHSKGVYGIPYRCFYSRNVKNLFLAGRIISASHVAFGSSRVMATGAHGGQAVGMAAKICAEQGLFPRDLNYTFLQQELLKTGQHLPNVRLENDTFDLAQKARISASSTLILNELSPNGELVSMKESVAQMLPLANADGVVVHPYADEPTELEVELRVSSKLNNHTPDVILAQQTIVLQKGRNCVRLDWEKSLPTLGYAYLIIHKNEKVRLQYSDWRITGILSVFNTVNAAVSNYGKQSPPVDIGVDEFEFWVSKRRPDGKNLALKFEQPLAVFQPQNVTNGLFRPTHQPNAWVADFEDSNPMLVLEWPEPQTVREVHLHFDTDFDHPMETVLIHHPENVMPFCVNEYQILDDKGAVLVAVSQNHQSINSFSLATPVETTSLRIILSQNHKNVPVSLMGVRVY